MKLIVNKKIFNKKINVSIFFFFLVSEKIDIIEKKDCLRFVSNN